MISIVDKIRFSGMIDGVKAERHTRDAIDIPKEQSVSEVLGDSNVPRVVLCRLTEPTGYGLFLRAHIACWKGVSIVWNPFKKTVEKSADNPKADSNESPITGRKSIKQGKPTRYVLNRKERRFLKTNLHRMSPFCSYCGVMMGIEDATLDHILPISKGGDDRPSNLCLCCSDCNSSKSNKSITEWQGRRNVIQGAKVQVLLENLKDVTKKFDAIFGKLDNQTLIPFTQHLVQESENHQNNFVPLTYIPDCESNEPQLATANSDQQTNEAGRIDDGNN